MRCLRTSDRQPRVLAIKVSCRSHFRRCDLARQSHVRNSSVSQSSTCKAGGSLRRTCRNVESFSREARRIDVCETDCIGVLVLFHAKGAFRKYASTFGCNQLQSPNTLAQTCAAFASLLRLAALQPVARCASRACFAGCARALTR